MARTDMQMVRRTARRIAVATLVPLLVFGALQVASGLSSERRELEVDSAQRAREVNARIDGRIESDAAALSVLATSAGFSDGRLDDARVRVKSVMAARPFWLNAILIEPGGRVVWQTGPREASAAELAEIAADVTNPVQILQVGGVARECACVRLHQPIFVGEGQRYVLTIERDVGDFQTFLAALTGEGEVAGIFDREGDFVARTVAHSERVGTPGTKYVQGAIRSGSSGGYSGVTYEGLRNHTVFETSALTGWSTHIAIPRARFLWLSAGSIGLTMSAAAITILLAIGFSVWAIRELGRQRAADLRAQQTQKLEALGRVAGQIAHDFNNLLTVIIANLRRLDSLTEEEARGRAIEHARTAADRAAKLSADILSFARSEPVELETVDLAAAVEDVRPMLVQTLGHKVNIEVDIARRARFVITNASQLERTLINLATNARDAMPDGGDFSITSRRSYAPGFVVLTVRDTGIGMPPETVTRAFEPFFTTKPEGKGTGLGLAQVQSLISLSGGSVELQSAPGEGTVIHMRLPAPKAGATRAQSLPLS